MTNTESGEGKGFREAETGGRGSRGPRRVSALARRPHLLWSRMVRGGGRWPCLLPGWLLLTSSTWKGERGWAHIRGDTALVANLSAFLGDRPFHFFPLAPPLLSGFCSPISRLLLKLGVGYEKLRCATKTQES